MTRRYFYVVVCLLLFAAALTLFLASVQDPLPHGFADDAGWTMGRN